MKIYIAITVLIINMVVLAVIFAVMYFVLLPNTKKSKLGIDTFTGPVTFVNVDMGRQLYLKKQHNSLPNEGRERFTEPIYPPMSKSEIFIKSISNSLILMPSTEMTTVPNISSESNFYPDLGSYYKNLPYIEGSLITAKVTLNLFLGKDVVPTKAMPTYETTMKNGNNMYYLTPTGFYTNEEIINGIQCFSVGDTNTYPFLCLKINETDAHVLLAYFGSSSYLTNNDYKYLMTKMTLFTGQKICMMGNNGVISNAGYYEVTQLITQDTSPRPAPTPFIINNQKYMQCNISSGDISIKRILATT